MGRKLPEEKAGKLLRQRSGAKNSEQARSMRRAGCTANLPMRSCGPAPRARRQRTLSTRGQHRREVRRLRKSIDLTVAELGMTAGISAGMLSKIENGTISPSLATLDALAKALNVPISRLFAETEERRDCSFVKAGHGVRIERRGTKAGHLYDLLGHSLAGEIGGRAVPHHAQRDAAPYTNFRHAGVEFIYMLSGKVRYRHARPHLSDGAGRRAVLRRRGAARAGGIDRGADALSLDHHLPAAIGVGRQPLDFVLRRPVSLLLL